LFGCILSLLASFGERKEKAMDIYLEKFLIYLEKSRRKSPNTVEAYKRDLIDFGRFLAEKNTELSKALNSDVVAYLLKLKKDGKSAATTNRKVASLRAFYTFLINQKVVSDNPIKEIKSPRIERKGVEYLSIEEVDKLLSAPNETEKGIRDKAILELMYATGIRVSELVEANVKDINLRMGFITCTGEHGRARIVPMGRPARAAVEQYIYDVRPKFVTEKETDALFVNLYGERLTRQGLWKIIKEYAGKAGIENKITPQTLRNSFAVHMVQNGADLKSLQELMGHEDISATQIYLTVSKNRIKDVYDRTHPRA